MQALFVPEGNIPAFSLRHADIRAKVGICVLASAATVVLASFQAQIILFVFSLLYSAAMRRPKLLLLAYGFAVIIFTTAFLCMTFMHALFPSLPTSPLPTLAVPFLRLVTMLNVILPLALTSGVQPLLAFLKTLRLPFCLYIPAAVMIRFIPTFMGDIRQVWETIRIRGYRTTPLAVMRQPRLFIRLLFTPILFRALRTSEELGIAAELKGLGYAGRLSPYKRPIWKLADTLLLIAAIIIIAAATGWELSLGDTLPKRVMH